MGRPANQIVDGNLRCVRCKADKPVDQFHRHCATKTGYRGTCKECSGHGGAVGRPPKLPMNGMDVCTKCGDTKPVAEFRADPRKKSGLRSTCRQCDNARATEYQGASVERYIKHILCVANRQNLKTRRKRKNKKAVIWQDNCITPEFLMQLYNWQNGKCAITGLEMTWVTGGGSAGRQFNISVDRRDSEQGYVPGNIQLVCKAVNLMKHDFDDASFKFWCKAVTDNS